MLKVRVVLLLPDSGSITLEAGYPPEDTLDEADHLRQVLSGAEGRPGARRNRLGPGDFARLRGGPRWHDRSLAGGAMRF
jgi:two-component system sensor histidine kinase KdpD